MPFTEIEIITPIMHAQLVLYLFVTKTSDMKRETYQLVNSSFNNESCEHYKRINELLF